MTTPTGILFSDPQIKPLSTTGQFQPGAYLLFYLTGTTTPANVYQDGYLQTPLSQTPGAAQPSCTADSAGRFNPIYLNPATTYRVQMYNSLGVKLEDTDPLVPSVGVTQSQIAALLYPQTPAELAASVTPTNYGYPPGVVDRYATNTSQGSTDMTTAFNAALNQFAQGGAQPTCVSNSTYLVGTALVLPTNCYFNLNQATLKSGATNNMLNLTSSRVAIMNGNINMSGGSGSAIYSSTSGGIQQFTFRDLYVIGGSGICVNMVNCYSGEFDNCFFTAGSNSAIVLSTNITGTPTNSIWMRCISAVNFSGTADTIQIAGGSGIFIIDSNFENNNNSGGSSVIHVLGNSSQGSSGIVIEGCYFEDGASKVGNCVWLGGAASPGSVGGIRVRANYFQSSKVPVYADTNTQSDLEVTGNTFNFVTGLSGAGVQTSISSFVPDVHNNSGSVTDYNRNFTPALQLGGAAVGMTGTFSGRISRNGNVVQGEVKIALTAKGTSTGAVTITNLPVAANSNSFYNQCVCGLVSNMASLVGTPTGVIQPGNTYANLFNQSATGGTSLLDSNLTNTAVLGFSFRYEI